MFDSYSWARPKRHFWKISLLSTFLLLAAGIGIFLLPQLVSYAEGPDNTQDLTLQAGLQQQAGQQQAVNMNCTLIVPPQPLTAQGLATPYQLVATNPNDGDCHESNKMQAAFVQAAVIDPNGQISIYDPLVIDQGTQPAAPTVVPTLAAGSTVGIWFGFNGNTLTLQDSSGMCVNGTPGSPFGQFGYCNAPAFFQAANQAIASGQLQVPALGTATDGLPCPTVRDFAVVDMDQSDNVTTTYLVTKQKQIAQNTATNAANMGNTNVQVNASDNRLLSASLDQALGCTPWMAPDLANPGHMATALPLDELQAANMQGGVMALVPNGDPMVLVNNNPNVQKLNLYRIGVDQPPIQSAMQASTLMYCMNLRAAAPSRLMKDMALFQNQPSPDPAAANNLFTFMAQRFVASYGANGLNCVGMLKMADPIKVQMQGNQAVAATINLQAGTDQQNQANGNNDNTQNAMQGQQSQQQTQQNQRRQGENNNL